MKNFENKSISLLFFQPEIPGNSGTLMRLAACWGVKLGLVEPLGFTWTDKHLRRAHMDYGGQKNCVLYQNWEDFYNKNTNTFENESFFHSLYPDLGNVSCNASPLRTVALVPNSRQAYYEFNFFPGDILILGSESCGLPQNIHAQCSHGVSIPMLDERRSMNAAVAGAIVWAHALYQIGWMDKINTKN